MVLRKFSIAALLLMLGLSCFAQSAGSTGSNSQDATAEARRARVQRHATPCWRQAGITPDMVNQRWKIEDQQRGKIAQVCADPSTSAQQKHDSIEQIHGDTDRAIGYLIPSQELAAFNKCEAELDQRRPKSADQKELGPCGGVMPKAESSGEMTAPQPPHSRTSNHR